MTDRAISEAEFSEIDRAFERRDKFAREHKITGADYDKFLEESAAFMTRIGELEDEIGPNLTEAEFTDKMMRWSKNWTEVIKRRVLARSNKEGKK